MERAQSLTYTIYFIQFGSKYLDFERVIRIKNVLQILI